MTDKEVIKALECCSTATCISNNCPYEKIHDIPTCTTKLTRDAFGLINRQKAEVERLQAEVDKQYEIAEANVRAEIASGGTSCHWCEDKVRAEAYKEFAERLKDAICENTYPSFDKDGKPVNIWKAKSGYDVIDNLLKEMAGDNNA